MISIPGVKEITDSELIEKAKNGDQSAFAEIVRRYKKKVSSTIYGMLGKCDEAQDIGQEVFIRFYNALNNFRGDSSLSTYLIRIAINLSLNEIRRRKIKRFLSFDKILEDGIEFADTSIRDDSDEKEIVHKSIAKLSPKYRSVLVLRLIDGYSTEETAKILNLPSGTVLSRLARAQSNLRIYLKEYLF